MTIAKQLRLVLGPAIDAARAALRDLDDDDVPGRFRAIAKQSDGKIPVPLVKNLLLRIDEDEWFRTKVIEAFDRIGSEDPTSAAYLNREPGWWITVAEAVTSQAAAEGEERVRQVETKFEEARSLGRAERAKAKALKKEIAAATRASRNVIAERLDPLKAVAAEARSECARAEEQVVRLRAEVEEAREDRREAERTTVSQFEQIRSLKREIAELRRSAEEGASESIPREPLDIARWLDRAAGTLTPFREAGAVARSSGGRADAAEPVIPAGVAPDSVAAIDALAGLDDLIVLIDGHNVLGVLDASTMADPRARRELIARLGKLDRHLGEAAIEVVFDSDLSDGRSLSVTENGIVVRFTEAEVIADDVLVELAAEHGATAVVISNDRELRDRCARHGATVLWARALAAWL